MSNLAEHEAEQAAITALCEAGECDHPECASESWHELATEIFDGAVRRDESAERAARVLLAIYPSYDDFTLEAAVQDVLTDLRDLCDLLGWNFARLNRDAHATYLRELEICGIAENAPLKSAIQRDLM